MTTFRLLETSWSWFGLVAREGRLLATFLPQPQRELRRLIKGRYPDAVEVDSLLAGFCHQVRGYFEGRPTRFDVEIDVSDLPPFRQIILELCRKIPFGRTASYAELARAAGKFGAARAVGGAMANNPLPLVIPCHRVLRSDGSLGGFSSRGGLDEKLRMLRLERALIASDTSMTPAQQPAESVLTPFRRERVVRRFAPVGAE